MSSTVNKLANAVYQQLPSLSGEKVSEMDPVPWTDPAVEPELPDEAEKVQELMEVIRRIQEKK